jgi:hypothetical protein
LRYGWPTQLTRVMHQMCPVGVDARRPNSAFGRCSRDGKRKIADEADELLLASGAAPMIAQRHSTLRGPRVLHLRCGKRSPPGRHPNGGPKGQWSGSESPNHLAAASTSGTLCSPSAIQAEQMGSMLSGKEASQLILRLVEGRDRIGE